MGQECGRDLEAGVLAGEDSRLVAYFLSAANNAVRRGKPVPTADDRDDPADPVQNGVDNEGVTVGIQTASRFV